MYTGVNAAVIGVQVLALPIVTRLLDPADYGVVVTAFVVSGLLASLANAGLPDSVHRVYFLGESGPRRARSLISLAIVVALAIVVVADLTGPAWAGLFDEVRYGWTLRFAVWMSAAAATRNAVLGYLRAAERAGRHAAVGLVSAAGGQLVGLALLGIGGLGPAGYVGGVAVGASAAAGLGVAWTGLGRGWRDRELLRWAAGFGVPIVPHELANKVLLVGDRLVIERLADLATVGRYQVAYRIGELGQILANSVAVAWAPQIHGAPTEHRWDLLASTRALLLRLAALLAGSLALLAPIALVVVAPATYAPLGLTATTAIVGATVLPAVVTSGAMIALTEVGRTRALAWSAPVSAVINVVGAVVLLGPLGLPGVALATLLGYGIRAWLLERAARREAPVVRRTAGALTSWTLGLTLVLLGVLAPVTLPWLIVRSVAGAALVTALVVVGWRATR